VEELERQVGTTRPGSPPVGRADTASTRAARETGAEPGRIEADEMVAARALERTLVQTGVLLLPLGQAELTPSLAYSHADRDAALGLSFDDEVAVTTQRIRRDVLDATVDLRAGLPLDAQLELSLPYNWVNQEEDLNIGFGALDQSHTHGSGWGDLRVGFAKTILQEQGWAPDLIGRFTLNTGSGESRDGDVALGSGFQQVQLALNAVKRQDPLVFASTVGYVRSFEDDDLQPGDEWRYSLTVFLAASPESSLRFGFAQRFGQDAESDGSRLKGSDFTAATFDAGASVILGPRSLLDVTASIGLNEEAPDFGIGVALPIRFSLPAF
jgi:hypothetical protein